VIKHIVLLDLSRGHDQAELSSVMAGLDALRAQISGFADFMHGPNRDFEQLSQDCTYAFICQFSDRASAQAYLVNKEHQALGKRLVALCHGGVGGLRVIDMEVGA